MPKITELYAWVVADTGPDDEGVPAMMAPNGMHYPLMGADMAAAEGWRPYVATLAQDLGKPVKLIRSTSIEVVETIDP